jgi:hypothetical protein
VLDRALGLLQDAYGQAGDVALHDERHGAGLDQPRREIRIAGQERMPDRIRHMIVGGRTTRASLRAMAAEARRDHLRGCRRYRAKWRLHSIRNRRR